MSEGKPGRVCVLCSVPLSRYNPEDICQSCTSSERVAVANTASLDSFHAALGPRLLQLRLARDLSQEALADLSGVSSSLISQIERGRRKTPNMTSLLALCGALNIPLITLLQPASEVPPKLQADPQEIPCGRSTLRTQVKRLKAEIGELRAEVSVLAGIVEEMADLRVLGCAGCSPGTA